VPMMMDTKERPIYRNMKQIKSGKEEEKGKSIILRFTKKYDKK
jgi:hypothetical protein